MNDNNDDLKHFGDCFVYCNQHMRPHKTGWCTVSNSNKIKLDAETYENAILECKEKDFELY